MQDRPSPLAALLYIRECKSLLNRHPSFLPFACSSSNMALAYPEGECFFVRTALDGPPNSGAYMASDEYQFYSHMMIEYIWNVEADHGQSAANFPDGYTHPRSDYKFVIGSTWGTIYGNWEYLPFSYGPSEGEITKRVRHPLCTSPNHFIAHENGASAEVSTTWVSRQTH